MRARATAAAAKAELELVRERLATDTLRADLTAAQHAAQTAHIGAEHRLRGEAWAAASAAAAGMPAPPLAMPTMVRRSGMPSPETVFAAAAAHAAATTGTDTFFVVFFWGTREKRQWWWYRGLR